MKLTNQIFLSLLLMLMLSLSVGHAQDGLDELEFENMDLSELLSVEITTASMSSESLFDAPAPMYVLTRKEIRDRGYTDFTDIMKDLPGFDIAHVSGAGEIFGYQRGFRSSFNNRTLVLLNGRTLTPLWFQNAPLGHLLPIESIEQIEVLYGPAGAIYGPNAFLGVINIKTTDASSLDPGEHRLVASTTGGSFNTKRIDAHIRSRVTEDISFTLSARFGRTDGADVSNRDNKWLRDDYTGSETIWGPILDQASIGIDYGDYGNPDDDHMVQGSLKAGAMTLSGYSYFMSGTNGPNFAGDRSQPNNFWPTLANGVSLEHEKNVTENLRVFSEFSYRTSGQYGLWLDASPLGEGDQAAYSALAYVDFSTKNNAMQFRQNFFWDLSESLKLAAGYRFLRKRLTKAFDIGDGYWGAYNSAGPDDNSAIYSTEPCDLDPEDEVTDDGYTNFESGLCEPWDNGAVAPSRMSFDNLVLTEDIGGFVEAGYRVGNIKFNLGLRYDLNTNPQVAPEDENDPRSHKGGYKALSPRAGIIYRFEDVANIEEGAIKLLYGEAIQEPAPVQLWGGWNGRASVEDLRPEQARNIEFVFMAQTGSFSSDLSLYLAQYSEVHVSPPANAGERQTMGVEYKGKLTLTNPIPNSSKVTGYLNATYTKSTSTKQWNFKSKSWVDAPSSDTPTGDIAPLKVHAGLNVPMMSHLNLNVRGRYIAARIPFLANALRNPARPSDKPDYLHAYFVADLALSYQYDFIRLNLQIYNLTNTDYNHPGDGSAGAGDGWVENEDGTMDTSVRSSGYRNSFVPQPLRNIMLTLTIDI